MLLAEVVETSRRITGTSKRLEKTALLAELLKKLNPEEVEVTVAFLSGNMRQGRVGIGYATVRAAGSPPAEEASLSILQVDQVLTEVTKVRGTGAEQRRRELIQRLMAAATQPEQDFLTGLLMGELRQGALEGIMLEGLSKAAGLPAERVRRAAMLAGGIGYRAPRARDG